MSKVNTETHVTQSTGNGNCSMLNSEEAIGITTMNSPWRGMWSAGIDGHREQERGMRVNTTRTHYTHIGNCQNLQSGQKKINIESCTWLPIVFLKKKRIWNWGSKGKPIRVDMTITNRNAGCQDIWLSLFLPFPLPPLFSFPPPFCFFSSIRYFTSEYY